MQKKLIYNQIFKELNIFLKLFDTKILKNFIYKTNLKNLEKKENNLRLELCDSVIIDFEQCGGTTRPLTCECSVGGGGHICPF